jgi:probable HAF family extracellular repeat protein
MDAFSVDHAVCRQLQRERNSTLQWTLARKMLLGLSLALACQCALAQAMYRIKPIVDPSGRMGISIADDFNGADEVTGTGNKARHPDHAFLWKKNGATVDLGPPEAGWASYGLFLNASGLVAGFATNGRVAEDYAFVSKGDGMPMTRIYNDLGGQIVPTGLNNHGQMVGDAYTDGNPVLSHAFLWKNDGSPNIDLGTLGGDNSYGGAINASGQVAGDSDISGNTAHHCVVWKNAGTPIHDLGTLGGASCSAYLINTSGQIAGLSSLPGTQQNPHYHAFFWANGGTPLQDLGTLGGSYSYPYALNNSGQIAGSATTGATTNQHAVVWMNDGTLIRDLGTLGGATSEASDINSSGQVTGYSYLSGGAISHAFLWRNDGTKMQDLNALIDPTDPLKPYVTLNAGQFINDSGDILAYGTDIRSGTSIINYLLQGTVLTLAPRSLAFGNQPINTTSAAKSVTVTNTSAKVVAVTSIALKGVAAGQFASTNNCGSSLVGQATCTIKVIFKPTTTGAKSATLNVNGGGGGLRVVSLTGTGT